MAYAATTGEGAMAIRTGLGAALLARLGALVLRARAGRAALALVIRRPDPDSVLRCEVLPELSRPLGWG